MEEKKEEKIGAALLKVALGYQLAEVTEEYAEVDGALKLTKRKKTKKDIPPDLKAVQMLLESNGGKGYAEWSEEELEKEKARLLRILERDLQREKAGDGSKLSEDAEGKDGEGTEKKPAVKKATAKKTTAKKTTAKKSAVRKTAKGAAVKKK